MTKKPRIKKPDLDTKIGKYFIAKQKGLTKKDAQIVAGFSDSAHATRIEATKTYQAIEKAHYADVLQKEITLEEIAQEHVKNIKQDQDRGAKNKAIEMAVARIEPDAAAERDDDRLIVILKA